MKRRLIVVISYLLVTFILFSSINFFDIRNSGQIYFANTGNAQNLDIEELTEILEEQLANNGTDVATELENLIEEYEEILPNVSTFQEEAKIQELIEVTEELTEFYLNKNGIFKQIVNPPWKHIPNPITTLAAKAALYASVAAAIAFFSAMEWELSAELLTKALTNKSVNTVYIPTHGNLVLHSQVFFDMAHGTEISEKATFPFSGSTIDQDLAFALHGVTYTKSSSNSRMVTITDTYDFAPDNINNFGFWVGVPTDIIYAAQQMGIITPYKVIITQTLPDSHQTSYINGCTLVCSACVYTRMEHKYGNSYSPFISSHAQHHTHHTAKCACGAEITEAHTFIYVPMLPSNLASHTKKCIKCTYTTTEWHNWVYFKGVYTCSKCGLSSTYVIGPNDPHDFDPPLLDS